MFVWSQVAGGCSGLRYTNDICTSVIVVHWWEQRNVNDCLCYLTGGSLLWHVLCSQLWYYKLATVQTTISGGLTLWRTTVTLFYMLPELERCWLSRCHIYVCICLWEIRYIHCEFFLVTDKSTIYLGRWNWLSGIFPLYQIHSSIQCILYIIVCKLL